MTKRKPQQFLKLSKINLGRTENTREYIIVTNLDLILMRQNNLFCKYPYIR